MVQGLAEQGKGGNSGSIPFHGIPWIPIPSIPQAFVEWNGVRMELDSKISGFLDNV